MKLLLVVVLFAMQGNGGKPAAASAQKSSPGGEAAAAAPHDHVGKPLPDYMTGDQCLFCHRNVVGPTWEREPHAWTIRDRAVPPSVAQVPKDATHIIGSPQHYRALKLSGYGKFDLLADD